MSATSTPYEIRRVPLLDLKAQYTLIRSEIIAAMERVLDEQRFILGPEVEALEGEISTYCNASYGIGVSSGSDALLVALMAIGIKPGDEVITTAYSFFATAGSVARLGARPVFVDIDPLTYNIDPQTIAGAVTERTRAIIPVDLYGQMADMETIMQVARDHNLMVIEDAAQAIGSEWNGRRAGSIADLSCFSFFPSKNLGAFGDGGMVTTNDSELADQVKLLRNHGYQPKYYNKVVGGNFRLDALQAAVLRVKLKYLDQWTAARQHNATIYKRLFAASSLEGQVSLPFEAPGVRHIYNQFVIRVAWRDELIKFLKGRQIGTEIYYPVPLHLQECFADLGYKTRDFLESELAANETLALPIYPELTEEMLETVVNAIREFYKDGFRIKQDHAL